MDSKRKRPGSQIVTLDIESASSSSEDDFATLRTDCRARVVPVKRAAQQLIERRDLAVNKTKVDAVADWLSANHQSCRLLVLSGPSGAGKTATLHTLASDLDFQVVEWLNPLDQNRDLNGQTYDQAYVNQASQFQDFLLSSGRYSSVFQTSRTRKLILVEEFPNTFTRSPELLRSIMQRYVQLGRCPVVFITSEHNQSLFSPTFIADLQVDQISFKAVSDTALSKAVDRLARLDAREDVSYEVRSAVCEAAQGDLRNAAVAWHFHTQGLSAGPRAAMKRPGRKRSKNQDKKDSGKDGKDESSEFLPSVGRVLYAKKVDDGGFKTEPQQVVDRFTSEANKFLLLAHENYVTIFSDIHSVTRAADWLSQADVLLNEWRDDNSCRELGFSLAVRGLMTSSYRPLMKWAPLRKSRQRQTADQAAEHVSRVKRVYACHSSSTQALLLDIIPLTAALRIDPYAGIVTTAELSEPESPQPIIDEDSDSS